jgi:hypothetical protein
LIFHRIVFLVVCCVEFRAQISFHWFNYAQGAEQILGLSLTCRHLVS